MYKAVVFILEESNITIMFESSYVIHNRFSYNGLVFWEKHSTTSVFLWFLKTCFCSVNLFRGNFAPLFHSFKVGVPGKAAVTTSNSFIFRDKIETTINLTNEEMCRLLDCWWLHTNDCIVSYNMVCLKGCQIQKRMDFLRISFIDSCFLENTQRII